MATATNSDGVISNIFMGSTDRLTQDNGIGIGGVAFNDESGNGQLDNGDAGKSGVVLTIKDQTGADLPLVHRIEPNDFAAGTVLTQVEPTATVSAVGSGRGVGTATARSFAPVEAAGNVFSGTDALNNAWFTWNASRQLRANFSSPVSTVSLRAYGNTPTVASFGRLDAYTADNRLVARFTTGPLTTAGFTTMTVSRAEGDIHHVIAYGKSSTSVVLDTLQWGPAVSATTGAQGGYALDYLPDGTYRIQATAPAGFQVTTPAVGYATVSVVGGRATSSVNFGVSNKYPFHNYASPANVDRDANGNVFPIDAQAVLNYYLAIRSGGLTINPADDPNVVGFVDVNADGRCSLIDAQDVVNAIVIGSGGGGGGGGGESEGQGGAAGFVMPNWGENGGGAEGEGASSIQVHVPVSAAEYYAQRPIQILDIPGDGPCNCGACRRARDGAVDRALSAATDAIDPALDAALEAIASDVGVAGRPRA